MLGIVAIIATGGFFVIKDQLKNYELQIEASQTFLPVDAEILSSDVKKQSNTNTASGGKTTLSFRPVIRYRYQLDDKNYTAERYDYFRGIHPLEEGAKAIAEQYPKGATRTAYYDPKNPQRAVLNNKKPDDAWVVGVFFAAFFLIAGGIAWMLIRTLQGTKSR